MLKKLWKNIAHIFSDATPPESSRAAPVAAPVAVPPAMAPSTAPAIPPEAPPAAPAVPDQPIERLERNVLKYWHGVLIADDVSAMEKADIRIAVSDLAVAQPEWLGGDKFDLGFSPKAKLALREIRDRADQEEARQLAGPPPPAPRGADDEDEDAPEDIDDDPVYIDDRIAVAMVFDHSRAKFETVSPPPAEAEPPANPPKKPPATPKPLQIVCWFPLDLDREGKLALPRDAANLWPRVVRSWLEPQPLSSGKELPRPLAHFTDYEKALTLFFQEIADNLSLPSYLAACFRLFQRLQASCDGVDYVRAGGGWGIVPRTLGHAVRALAEVYSSIDDSTRLGALEQLLGNHKAAVAVDVGAAAPAATIARHVAMVDKAARAEAPDAERAADPLNDSQRRALYALLELKQEAGVIAVSGPPGTGKTAMLRAMIANQWVLAAAEGRDDCPVTLVCGATNQSVENVMGTFDGSVGEADLLARRWLDGKGKARLSYTAGSPSKAKRDAHAKRYATLTVKRSKKIALTGVGASRGYWNADNLPGAALLWARHFEDALKAVPLLRGLASGAPDEVSRTVGQLYRIAKSAGQQSSCTPNQQGSPSTAQMRKDAMAHLASLAELLRAMLGASIQSQQRAAEDVLRDSAEALAEKYPCDGWDSKWTSGLFADLAKQSGQAQRRATAQKIVDVTLRPISFHLAARYWEARWLLGLEGLQPGADRCHDLRRLAMLFPCMVSTLHSAPKLLAPGGQPQFGFVDLLIIDEAGQAAPELGAPVLAMSHQAVVVGDLKQLAPVSSVTRELDARLVADRYRDRDWLALWRRRGADAAGGSIMRLAVSGCSRSEMTAGRALRGLLLREHYRCARSIINICIDLLYHEHDRDGDGAVLAPELIPMIEDPLPGMLADADLPPGSEQEEQALRDRMKDTYPLPPVGFYQTGGPNDEPLKGESWSNPGEVGAIVQWLQGPGMQLARWVARSRGRPGEHEDLAKLVAIVTPFRGQAQAIREAVKAGLDHLEPGTPSKPLSGRLTIGTVHTLQGAEKPVVLFSAVNKDSHATRRTEDNYRDRVFIDRDDGRLLNVAISRAQKSFILFGHSDLFFSRQALDPDNDLPSAIVGRCLAGVADSARELATGVPRAPAKKLGPTTLMVVESPHKADIIQALLPLDVQVFGSGGHLRNLAGAGAIDWADGLKPRWYLSARDADGALAAMLERVAGRLLQCEELVLGTDNDAQGEAIAWHLLDLLREAPWFAHVRRVRRVRFDALTGPALARAFADAVVVDLAPAGGAAERAALACRSLNMGLAYGALATRVLDNLIGSVYTRHGVPGGGRVKGPLLRALAGDGDAADAPGGRHTLAIALEIDGQRCPARLVASVAGGPWRPWGSALRAPAQALADALPDAQIAPVPCLDEADRIAVPSYDEIGTNAVLREVFRRHGMLPSATMQALQLLYERQPRDATTEPARTTQPAPAAGGAKPWARLGRDQVLELADEGHLQFEVMRQDPWLMTISSGQLLSEFDFALSLLSQRAEATPEDYLAFLEKWALRFDDTGATRRAETALQGPSGPTHGPDGALDLFSFQPGVPNAGWRARSAAADAAAGVEARPPAGPDADNAPRAGEGAREGAHGALVPLDARIDADSELMRHFPADAQLVYRVLQRLALGSVLSDGHLAVRRRVYPLLLPWAIEGLDGAELAVEVGTAVAADDRGWFRIDPQGLAVELSQWGGAGIEDALSQPGGRGAARLHVHDGIRTKSLPTPTVDRLLAWMEARRLGRPSTFGLHVEALLKGAGAQQPLSRRTPE